MTLGWALLIIAIVYFAIVSPGFRKIGLLILAGLVVLFIVVVIYISRPKPSAEPTHSTAVMPASQPPPVVRREATGADLEVTDLKVGPAYSEVAGYRFRATGYELSARIKNKSQFAIPNITGELVALDCRTPNSCEVTGREHFSTYSLAIPPGETRQLRVPVSLRSVAPAKNQRKWKLELE